MQFISSLAKKVDGLMLVPYLLVAGTAAIVGSIALLLTAHYFKTAFGVHIYDYDSNRFLQGPAPVFYLLVFAPISETLLLAGLLKLLLMARSNPWYACGISALLWGVLHGVSNPMRFFGSVWSFYVFGGGYLLWRRRSFQHAFAAAAVPHMIVNSVVTMLVVATGGI